MKAKLLFNVGVSVCLFLTLSCGKPTPPAQEASVVIGSNPFYPSGAATGVTGSTGDGGTIGGGGTTGGGDGGTINPSSSPVPSNSPAPSPSPVASSSPIPSSSPVASSSPAPSSSPVASNSPIPSVVPSSSPIASVTPSSSPNPGDGGGIPTPSPSPGGDGGGVPSPTPSVSPQPSSSPTPSVSPRPSVTPQPSASPSVSPQPSASPSVSPQPSVSPRPSVTPQPSASPSVSPRPSVTPSATPHPSSSPSPSPSCGHDAGFLRVCSQRRSQNQDFIFFEDAQNPILTVEYLYKAKTKGNNGVGNGLDPQPPGCPPINDGAGTGPGNPGNKGGAGDKGSCSGNGMTALVVYSESLRNIDLLQNPKPTVPVRVDIAKLQSVAGKNWRTETLYAYVCDDREHTGKCSDKGEIDTSSFEVSERLSINDISFRADRIPAHIQFEVWSGRGMQLATDPDYCEKQYSPLVLDLKNNGIKLTGPTSGTMFDLNDAGEPVLTGWVDSADDAFLVRDLNGNGIIDSGAELFGNATRLPDGSRAANGFEALKALDSNNDGVFDNKDAAWNEVKLWLDVNQNGRTDRGELVSLDRAGVVSINLNYISKTDVDQYGNATKQRSTFKRRVNGVIKDQFIIDVWFNTLVGH